MNFIPNTPEYFNHKYSIGAVHSYNPNNKIRIEKVMSLVVGKRVLDIGCGEGVLVNLLAGKGYESHGVDFSKTGIAHASQGKYSPAGRLPFTGRFCIADITKRLPFMDREFDTITMCEVIEHFEDADFLFKESIRLLKPGGRIIVDVPTYKKEGHPEHVRDFTEDSLRRELLKYGYAFVFRVSDVHFVAYVDIKKEGT